MSQGIKLNGNWYPLWTSRADRQTLRADIADYIGGFDLDDLRRDATANRGPIIVREGSEIIYIYEGYEEFNQMNVRGERDGLYLTFDRTIDYEKSLIDIFGFALNLTETKAYKRKIYLLANYAPDELALDNKWAYEEWRVGSAYKQGFKVNYGDGLYKCLIGHVSKQEYNPVAYPDYWKLLERTE